MFDLEKIKGLSHFGILLVIGFLTAIVAYRITRKLFSIAFGLLLILIILHFI